MKTLQAFIGLIFLITVAGCNQPPEEKVFMMDWLIGTWQNSTSRGTTYETWKRVGETELQGKAFRIIDGDSIILETILIIEDKGQWFYIPTVPDQNKGLPVRFKATRITGSEMLFENPDHDSPNAIFYRKVGEGALIAEIWTLNDEKKKVVEFPMNRIN